MSLVNDLYISFTYFHLENCQILYWKEKIMIPEKLKQAKSIEEVVQIIDSGGTESSSPEELAAAYAYLQTIKRKPRQGRPPSRVSQTYGGGGKVRLCVSVGICRVMAY